MSEILSEVLHLFISILIGGMFTFYVTSVLLWDDSIVFGPFTSRKSKVIRTMFVNNEYVNVERPVNLIDRLRRFFGLYAVDKDKWMVIEMSLPVWVCPKCLSFWVVSPMTAWYFMHTYSVLDSVIFHGCAAALSYVLFLWQR